MARIPIIMPKMSMTMTEGDVGSWLVEVGDEVAEGDVVAEVMTDKVDMEVESTHTGTLVEITVTEGTVAVGEPIGYLEGEDTGFGDLLGGDDEPDDAAPEPDTEPAPEPVVEKTVEPEPEPEPEPERAAGPVAAVPRARGLAREHGLDLARISGSGADGLVTVADVEAAASNGRAPTAKTPKTTKAPESPQAAATKPPETKGKKKTGRSGLIRAAVARKMVESASVPQFTVWRELRLDQADARRGGISWTTVLLQAYAAAMRDVPELLCRWEDGAATPSGPPSVALAVATEDGLMVPVFREPDLADPAELDAEVKAVVRNVQGGRLEPAYLGVANGSLSNLGGLGIDRFQALVTPPQASVLALGSIAPRPVAVPGGVGVALSVSAGLTVDHRVADGAQGAQLLARFAARLDGSEV